MGGSTTSGASSARKKIRNGPHAISACSTTLVKHALPTLTKPRGSHGSAAAAISAPRETRSAASCARTAAAAVRPPNSTVSAAVAAASSATTSGRPVDHADEGGSDTDGELRNGSDGLRDTVADDAWGAEGEEAAADAAAVADALLAAAMAAHDRGAPPAAAALGVPGAGAGAVAGIVALVDGEAAAPEGETAVTAGGTVAASTGVDGGFCDDATLLVVLLG